MKFDFSKEPGKELVKPVITEKNKKVAKLSVITPFYNSGTYFEQTYRCLINQTMEDYEWIIVNDGSTREEDVQKLEQLALTDVRIRVFHQKNTGQSVAKNYGIREAKTDVIVFIDADDLVEPFYLEILYEALLKHPKAAWSYTDLVGFAGQEYVWCKRFSAGRMTFNNILVNAAAFRKSAIDAVGAFTEAAKYYDEDWALYLKLLSAGMHPVHVPVIGFWYRKSETGMQQTVRRNKELREESDRYIQELAKGVDIRIEEEVYKGSFPEGAVKSEYGKPDEILAKIMSHKIGLEILKGVYSWKK